jgi:hypothetical protein
LERVQFISKNAGGRIMSVTRWTTILVLLFSILVGSSSALAKDAPKEGLDIPPGMWLFDISVLMPMQSQATTQTVKSCVGDDPMTADTLMPWVEDQGCKIRSVRAVENKLTWKLRCKRDGQRSRGKGEFVLDGNRGAGKATVNFEMGGRTLTIRTNFTAARVGDCVAAGASEAPSTVDSEKTE